MYGNQSSIIITTETYAPDLAIDQRLDLITAECACGINVFKDFITSVSDIAGGRSKTTQNILREARKNVLAELRNEAAELGAHAVVGVDLDYSEFSSKDKSMLFVVASGTAVTLKGREPTAPQEVFDDNNNEWDRR